MGVLALGSCYSDASAAVDAFFGSQGPELSQWAGAPALSFLEKLGGEWRHSVVQDGVLVSQSPVVVPAFVSCDPGAAFVDGAAVGFAIAVPLILASVVIWARRAMEPS